MASTTLGLSEPTMRRIILQWLQLTPDSLAARSVRKGKSAWIDAVHLLWSVWIFITPMFDDRDRWNLRWLVLTVLSYPLFLLLYAKCCVGSRRESRIYACLLVVLCMVLMPWYPSGLTYFVYGCVMLSSCSMPFRSYMTALAGLNAAILVESWLLHYPWQAVISLPVTTSIIGLVIYAERMSDERQAQLQLSYDEVRRLAATAERERIGRDLHDLLGHTLSLITLKLELSRKLFDRDTEAARREVAEAEKVARHALAEVRCAVTGIRATDLAAELASARLLLESSQVHVEYAPPPSLPVEIERGLALILREAVTNIARHAGATCAQIEIACENGQARMQIGDDGRGGIAEDGNGLSGMRERVRALGGRLQIQSLRGQGTRLRVEVPLPVAAIAAARALPSTSPTSPMVGISGSAA